jgi:CheY-like chemotaxis protein
MRVLVAHSDRWTRLVLADALVDAGFFVDEASNGVTALRLAQQQQHDLVVLVGALSELSSREVSTALRTTGVPVIVVRNLAWSRRRGVAPLGRTCGRRRSVRAGEAPSHGLGLEPVARRVWRHPRDGGGAPRAGHDFSISVQRA